ncbi:MAG: Hsp20/alpha crystallin family protein [Phycisphaerae bacterium]|jgi:HSP20 family protein
MMMTRRLFPFLPTAALDRDLGRAVEELFNLVQRGPIMRPLGFPALNIWEDGQSLMAEAEVPGLTMDDIEVFVVGNELTIKGNRRPPAETKATYHRQERGTGEFTRVVTLPVDVDPDKVEATLKNGVLLITMPKAEQARARKIAVRTA